MQCFKCCTWLIRFGIYSIRGLLLVSSIALFTQTMRLEAAPRCAAPCTLAWNQTTDPSVVGYALYYGITSSAVTNRFVAGMTNRATFNGLLACSNYFFYVTTCNAMGIE